MTNGTFTRNARVPTSGQFSGPYTVGLLQTKTWSGANYPSGKPLRTNVYPPKEIQYRQRTFWSSKLVTVYRTRYVKVFAHSTPVKVKVDPKKPGSFVRIPKGSYTWVPVRYVVVKKVREARSEPVGYLVRPRTVWSRPPKRARLTDHAYSCSYQNSRTAVVNYNYSGVGNFSQASNSIISAYTVTGGWSSNDDLALLGRLRTKVAGSDFNAGIALAECHKSLQMIANAATRIYTGLRALKRGDVVSATFNLVGHRGLTNSPKGFKKRATTVQDRWLELQYGWLPLLNDVHGAAQFLAHHLNTPIQQTVRAKLQRAHGISWPSSGWRYDSSTILTKKSIKATIREKDVAQLSGLSDPASVAWEIVPYSFVVDWFLPIGNYLSARGLSQALVGSYVTSASYRELHSGITPFNQPISVLSKSGAVFQEVGNFQRTISSSLEVPLPSWKTLSDAASWKHCANAVALLTSTDFARTVGRQR